ncbi:XRE family transcriptional regulator [Streptomyces sp. NPDC002176]|uniref:XRE family transcriptional regulator n=1 Tax=Streptomyces sp. NPDC002176 TaxID=3364634 RepID=UPI00384B0C2D
MTAPMKPGSKADRGALRTAMLAKGASHLDIAVEMRTRYRMRPREAWRHALGWTLQDAADRITQASAGRPGEAVGADASLVGKWEKWPSPGARRPSLAVLLAMAAAYGCTPADLLDLEDRNVLPERDLRVLSSTRDVPAEARAIIEVPPSVHVPEPVGSDLVRLAADESAAWATWAEASNIGDIALDQLMAETRALASDYLTSDPIVLFTRTRALRDRVFALLEGHRYPRQSGELYLYAGYLCGLLAWMSSDLGQLRDADTQGRTAWLCAELTGHDDLRAWVLSTRSAIAFSRGCHHDAIGFARRGATYPTTGSVAVLLACQEADAWSELAAVDKALGSLARAYQARDAATGEDEVGGIFACPQARLENYAAAVNLRSGRPADALLAATRAHELIVAQPVRAYGTKAQIHISQAAAHLAAGEAEGALEALEPVLVLPPNQRLAPVARRLGELTTGTKGGGVAAISLCAAIEEWCVDSAPRRLALSPGTGAA